MKSKILSLLTILILSQIMSGETKAQFDHLSGLEKYLFEVRYRDHLLNGHKNRKPFDDKKECTKIFDQSKGFWEEKKKDHKGLMEEGRMERAFSREEIEKMGTVNIHGLKTKVRGTDKYLPGGYASGPYFPHAYPGCKDFFLEDTKVIDVGSQKCRQIKFTHPIDDKKIYYQVYCQDSTRLLMNFDAENLFDAEVIKPKSVDCVHCQ